MSPTAWDGNPGLVAEKASAIREHQRDKDTRTALVTGATGFLGLNLVRELTDAGWDVIALHRRGSDLKYLRRFPVRLAEATLEDPASLERAMPEGLDAAFHAAADLSSWHGHRDRQTRANVDGTRHMVEARPSRKASASSSTPRRPASTACRASRSTSPPRSWAAARASTTSTPRRWPRTKCAAASTAGWTR